LLIIAADVVFRVIPANACTNGIIEPFRFEFVKQFRKIITYPVRLNLIGNGGQIQPEL
jgi:hypothetical protein